MDRQTKNLVAVTIQLASGVVLKHIQNEMIIVDADGNIIEGARQVNKKDAKNLGDEMVEAFQKAGLDFQETEEEKMYREAKELVDKWLES